MRKKKKRLNITKIVFFLLIIIVLVIIIKIFTDKTDSNNEEKSVDTSTAKIEENDNITVKEEKILEYSSKQKKIKDEKLAENKLLSQEGLPVLMYHFFYDTSKGEKGKDGNWIEISKFEEQIKYLAENNFYFPTWQEVEDFIDGKQELPEKSVVITVDDGDPSFFDLAVPIIQ